MQKVAVILVNYKNEAKTIACLHALENSSVQPSEVFVVDNSCTENSKQIFLSENFSLNIKWIWSEGNVGFAAGCNKGIRAAQKQGFDGYIWLLNNDTEPEATALLHLLETAKKTGAGVTGSQIVDSNGKFIGGVGLAHPKFASVGRPADTSCKNFDYIEGSSFLISPECIKKVGLLSEKFFLYFEESDYCYRAKHAGFTLAWATDSIVRHHIGSSTGSENAKGKVPYFIDCIMIRNRILFARRNGFPFSGILFGLLVSLCLRIKRLQFNRVLQILWILISQKNFKNFVEKNGGLYEI